MGGAVVSLASIVTSMLSFAEASISHYALHTSISTLHCKLSLLACNLSSPLTSDSDGRAHLWDVAAGQVLRAHSTPPSAITHPQRPQGL